MRCLILVASRESQDDPNVNAPNGDLGLDQTDTPSTSPKSATEIASSGTSSKGANSKSDLGLLNTRTTRRVAASACHGQGSPDALRTSGQRLGVSEGWQGRGRISETLSSTPWDREENLDLRGRALREGSWAPISVLSDRRDLPRGGVASHLKTKEVDAWL